MLDIKKELQEVTDLISLPEIYLKIRRLMDDETSDINDFAKIISVDPNLSARVLRVVNSAYFGLEVPVDSMSRALNLIGLGPLHNMVLGISAVSSLELPNEIMPLKPFWFTSLYTGVLARLMADRLRLERSDRLFLAGLLHNIGNLVFCAKFPDHAREAIKRSTQTGKPQHEAQTEMFDFHYGDIGSGLLANWKLSDELQTLVRFQPTPLKANGLLLETSLLHLAHAFTTSANPADVDDLVDPDVRDIIPLNSQDITESADMARVASEEMVSVILS